MAVLDTVAVLLDHHTRLGHSSESENGIENRERLFDVPVRMLTDINQEVGEERERGEGGGGGREGGREGRGGRERGRECERLILSPSLFRLEE